MASATPSWGSVPAPSSSRRTRERAPARRTMRGEVLHVRGESGQRLLDGLLIADVREDPVEQGERRALRRRDLHPELVHEGEEADGLQADGLAARVRPRDDEHPLVAPRGHGDRHDPGAQERMPGVAISETSSERGSAAPAASAATA